MPALGPVPGSAVVPGQLRVLSCPPALCPHAEFALASALGTPVSLRWTPQPRLPGHLQAAMDYAAVTGMAGQLAARLRTLGPVRFEVVEGGAPGVDPERYSYDPDLGLHRAALSAAGDVVVSESQLLALLADTASAGAREPLAHGLSRLIGEAWDVALDGFRESGEGAPVTWLGKTG